LFNSMAWSNFHKSRVKREGFEQDQDLRNVSSSAPQSHGTILTT
jgi:hypothetical protein